MENKDRFSDIKEAWKFIVDKYGLLVVITMIVIVFLILFLPFSSILIGIMFLIFYLVRSLTKLYKQSNTENLCHYKYYDFQNPISISITFITNFGIILLNIMYSMLQLTLAFMALSRLNHMHSLSSIINHIKAGQYKVFPFGIGYLAIPFNILAAVIPFCIVPLFWKAGSNTSDYFVDKLAKQMLMAIDKPKLMVLGIGCFVSLVCGIVFAFIRKPKSYCNDEKYRKKFIKAMKINTILLFILVPVILYMYGGHLADEFKTETSKLMDIVVEKSKEFLKSKNSETT